MNFLIPIIIVLLMIIVPVWQDKASKKKSNIGNWAFCRCTKLTSVIFPINVSHIADNAFSGCKQLTATVQPGSYAEAYCKENNIKYTYVS